MVLKQVNAKNFRSRIFKVYLYPLSTMGLVRLRVKELAAEKGWTLKEVSDRSGVDYSALKVYARSSGLATVDVTVLHKLARTFEVLIEDLYEIVKD